MSINVFFNLRSWRCLLMWFFVFPLFSGDCWRYVSQWIKLRVFLKRHKLAFYIFLIPSNSSHFWFIVSRASHIQEHLVSISYTKRCRRNKIPGPAERPLMWRGWRLKWVKFCQEIETNSEFCSTVGGWILPSLLASAGPEFGILFLIGSYLFFCCIHNFALFWRHHLYIISVFQTAQRHPLTPVPNRKIIRSISIWMT